MTYTPNKTDAARERDEIARKYERATAAVKKFGEAMGEFFRKLREHAVTQKRFHEATKDFYK